MKNQNASRAVAFIFEDEFEMREKIKDFFIDEGYEVREAASYGQAIELLKELSPEDDINIAILDIKQDIGARNLPVGISAERVGFHLAEAIRKRDHTVPIIFLTAYEEMKEDSKKYDPFKFFTKGAGSPFKNVEQFKKTVREAINAQENHRSYRELPRGKICIKYTRGKQSHNFILDIHDILFFETTNGSYTKIKVKHDFKAFTLTMNAIEFKKKLAQVMDIQELQDCFTQVNRGKYANLDYIVAFDEQCVYYDYDCKQRLEINTQTYQMLRNKYPYFKTT